MHFQVPCGWGWASILGLVHESISHAWNLCKVWDDALQELSWTMTGPGSQASQAPKAQLRVIFYNFWGTWNPGTHLRNPSEEPIWGTHLILTGSFENGRHPAEGSFQHLFLTVFTDARAQKSRSVPLSCWWQRSEDGISWVADRIRLRLVCHLFFFWMARNCQNLFCW